MTYYKKFGISPDKINRNMGCIEITFQLFQNVLLFWINRNMGCIEMQLDIFDMTRPALINRNMGCIEIEFQYLKGIYKFRLIETWDVLKWQWHCGIWERILDRKSVV